MISKKLTVTNSQGFHMRPAGVFAAEMAKFKSTVSIMANGKTVDGKSLMYLISACIKCGTEIEITCSGEDEAEMLEKAVSLVESGLGEQ